MIELITLSPNYLRPESSNNYNLYPYHKALEGLIQQELKALEVQWACLSKLKNEKLIKQIINKTIVFDTLILN